MSGHICCKLTCVFACLPIYLTSLFCVCVRSGRNRACSAVGWCNALQAHKQDANLGRNFCEMLLYPSVCTFIIYFLCRGCLRCGRSPACSVVGAVCRKRASKMRMCAICMPRVCQTPTVCMPLHVIVIVLATAMVIVGVVVAIII